MADPSPTTDQALVPTTLFERVARRFRILGEPVRLELLNILHRDGEMNVQELVAASGHAHANVSKHLRVMAEADLVSRRKDGLYVYYKLLDPTLPALCMLVCGHLERNGSPE